MKYCAPFNSISRKGFIVNAQEKTLHIDIPVKLTQVKIVFSIASLSFEGGLAASIFHLQLITNDISDWKAKSDVVVVFHTNAGYVTLHDQAYNRAVVLPPAILTRSLLRTSWNGVCRSSSVELQQKHTAGEMQTSFPG